MPAGDGERLPLFSGERRNRLERLEPACPPFEDARLGAELVGPPPGPDARGRKKIPTADPEELRILAAGYIQTLMLDESPVVGAENQQRRVAVATVDVRWLAGSVGRKLRDRHEHRAGDVEGLDRTRS
jgi:hypothetical protein